MSINLKNKKEKLNPNHILLLGIKEIFLKTIIFTIGFFPVILGLKTCPQRGGGGSTKKLTFSGIFS